MSIAKEVNMYYVLTPIVRTGDMDMMDMDSLIVLA